MHFYAISRQDLSIHQQAIQSGHAQVEYCRLFGPPDGEHPAFVWLTVENKWELLQLSAVLRVNGIRIAEFHDPDYPGYDPSAIACLIPEKHRFLLSCFPLWNPYPVEIRGKKKGKSKG